ncbi:hypothetical protein M514_18329, partial [Trichuris suis]
RLRSLTASEQCFIVDESNYIDRCVGKVGKSQSESCSERRAYIPLLDPGVGHMPAQVGVQRPSGDLARGRRGSPVTSQILTSLPGKNTRRKHAAPAGWSWTCNRRHNLLTNIFLKALLRFVAVRA